LRRDPLLKRTTAIITLVRLHTHPLVGKARCAGTPKRWLISTGVPHRHIPLLDNDNPVAAADLRETYRIAAR
jgi:hypothetical protein